MKAVEIPYIRLKYPTGAWVSEEISTKVPPAQWGSSIGTKCGVKSEPKASTVIVTNIGVETVAESTSRAVINLSDIGQAVRKYVFEADNDWELQPADRQ